MNEREYYRRRAEIERACARDAASPEIAAIHSDLAMRYNLVAETGDDAAQSAEQEMTPRLPLDESDGAGNSRRSRRSGPA